MALERQEIHCHACNRYVQFSLDTEMDGNYVLHCPNCGHEHCRRVEAGRVTDVRWDTRNGPAYQVTNVTYSTSSMTSGTSSTFFLSVSWASTGGTTGGYI